MDRWKIQIFNRPAHGQVRVRDAHKNRNETISFKQEAKKETQRAVASFQYTGGFADNEEAVVGDIELGSVRDRRSRQLGSDGMRFLSCLQTWRRYVLEKTFCSSCRLILSETQKVPPWYG